MAAPAPSGYSYFLGQEGNGNLLLATETALHGAAARQDVEFDYTDFTPIMKLGDDYTLIVVNGRLPLRDVRRRRRAARNERVVVGISGATGLDNIVFTLIEEDTGVEARPRALRVRW